MVYFSVSQSIGGTTVGSLASGDEWAYQSDHQLRKITKASLADSNSVRLSLETLSHLS